MPREPPVTRMVLDMALDKLPQQLKPLRAPLGKIGAVAGVLQRRASRIIRCGDLDPLYAGGEASESLAREEYHR